MPVQQFVIVVESIGEVAVRRGAPSLAEAIVAEVRELEAVGLRPVRVMDQDWVTLGEIAARVGHSRELVRLWSTGRQGPGGFPAPLNGGGRVTYYSWIEVLPWLRDRLGYDLIEEEPVRTSMSLALRLRRLAPRISRMDLVDALLSTNDGVR